MQVFKWLQQSTQSTIWKNHKSAILVMTDRTTLVTMIEKLGGKSADEVYDRMSERLVNFNSSWVRTITFDNGKEFVNHHKIAGRIKEAEKLLSYRVKKFNYDNPIEVLNNRIVALMS